MKSLPPVDFAVRGVVTGTFVIVLLFLTTNPVSTQPSNEARVGIVRDADARGNAHNDQASFAAAIRCVNIQVDTLATRPLPDLSSFNILIVPKNSAFKLDEEHLKRILSFIQSGGNVITDCRNLLAEKAGIRFLDSAISIERLHDRLNPDIFLKLPSADSMTLFETNEGDDILCTEQRSHAPVVIGRTFGNGLILFFGIEFDPTTTGGYSRFPFLIQYMKEVFHCGPIFKNEHLELYFDPGYRNGTPLGELVNRWIENGVRVIHAAGWHQFPTYSYDYARLINLCHANGILVYAWLSPPHVSQKFWQEHPEWREVNYKGLPVKSSWRSPMALTQPECLNAVKSIYKNFLEAYDWDGVNLAELYFEGGNGPDHDELLTPMHASVRTEFKTTYGFDPVEIFDATSERYWKNYYFAWKKFEAYRVRTLTRLHEEFLQTIEEVRGEKPYLDVIVTAMDNFGSPELLANHGVDISGIIELGKSHTFTLQIEDPQSSWSNDPRRYEAIAGRYRTLLGERTPFKLDLNIVNFRDSTSTHSFSTRIQTGTECYLMVNSAARGGNGLSIYSESSIRPSDFDMIAHAASSSGNIRRVAGGWEIFSPFTVTLTLSSSVRELRDERGRHYTGRKGTFILPAGEHQFIVDEKKAFGRGDLPHLLSITGTLLNLQADTSGIAFRYTSDTRCLASFDLDPVSVTVDEREQSNGKLHDDDRFTIILPVGEHEVLIRFERGGEK